MAELSRGRPANYQQRAHNLTQHRYSLIIQRNLHMVHKMKVQGYGRVPGHSGCFITETVNKISIKFGVLDRHLCWRENLIWVHIAQT